MTSHCVILQVLVFSQSLLSLDLIEEFLARVNEAHESSSADNSMSEYLDSWLPGKDYYRMDGSTAADTRKIWCKYFNKPTNYRMRLFLISTKAGGLGINLVAANRVIVFDASWNPSHDIQSIFRVFRFGQTKPVYIYRSVRAAWYQHQPMVMSVYSGSWARAPWRRRSTKGR